MIITLTIAVPGFVGLRFAQAATMQIVVNSNGDSGTCSGGITTLRCAIATANANTTSPTAITFNFNGTITVGRSLTINNINQPITIDGSGQTIIIDGSGSTQIFSISANTTVTLNALTISHGSSSYGGGVNNGGTLTISNSTLSGNSAYYGGGDQIGD